MAELVYAHDSKSCSSRIEGSIPSSPTKMKEPIMRSQHVTPSRLISLLLLLASGVILIAFQIKPAGWVVLGLSCLSLLLADRKFAKDLLLVNISLAIIGLTPITTDISYGHFALMGSTLTAAVLIPYLVSRFVYRDYHIRFPFHHGRKWYKKEIAYIGFAGVMAYLILPFYLTRHRCLP